MGDMVSKVKELEDCMGAFMKKQSDQIKELSEIVTVQTCQGQSKPLPPVFSSLKDQVCPETPRSKKKRLEAEQASHEPFAPPEQMNTDQVKKPNYAAAAAAAIGGITPLQKPGAKINSVLVFGKANTGRDDAEEILAADVELVATGVSRDVTSEQLKNIIVTKGIDVLEIVKLTTFEQARTNTFKIKIRAAQYNKAMNRDIWPLRI